jgi:hypothetical protein
MEEASNYPFCGASNAYVKVNPGVITQKIYVGPYIFFTDRTVLIFPPVKQRLKAIGVTVGAYALGGEAGLHTSAELTNLSAEGRVKRVNELLSNAIYEKYGPKSVTADDIIAEFGDWADVWPNSWVSRVTMSKKGLLPKRLQVVLKPQSGLSRMYECPFTPTFINSNREMLNKAFGNNRLVDRT